MDNEIREQKIKLIVLDVDGVLTNGQLIFGTEGELMKKFHAQDGLGIALAHNVGLKTAIITGRRSQMVEIRSAELNIADVYQGKISKVEALDDLMTKYDLTLEEIAYVGDDLNDLPVLIRVGLPCAVANAVSEVKEHAYFVTQRPGGNGAVREVIEHILKIQGKWEEIIKGYLQDQVMDAKQ
ncbi:KdsC family phosphatase [Pelosinus sp. sgz500959]|uniref:KdsC family phosphatase n=1 Tax=Pelosinus sp. sgz500959 TaxID=3242472 RepID=UPI003671979C